MKEESHDDPIDAHLSNNTNSSKRLLSIVNIHYSVNILAQFIVVHYNQRQ